MAHGLTAPREELSDYAPRLLTIKIHPDKIREVIGKGGSVIRSITEETGTTIDITDDGIGFDTTATTPGFGIEHSIRRRLDKVGGHTEIESAPGQGTTVRLHVPRR